jgi:hypothetical protein
MFDEVDLSGFEAAFTEAIGIRSGANYLNIH